MVRQRVQSASTGRFRLHQLHEDVLAQILKELQQSTRGLFALSETCRLFRYLCKPLIFSHPTFRVQEPIRSRRRLIPSFMWPYIRHLTLIDECLDRGVGGSATMRLIFARDPYLCGVLDGPKLFSLLRQMPRLTKLSLVLQEPNYVHGVSCSALKSILTLPQLREFSAVNLLLSPTESSSSDSDVLFPPLTLLHHERSVSHQHPPTITEQETVILILTKLCRSLEALTLPAELVPVSALSTWDWPRLRELRIRGLRWETPSTSYASIFSAMRGLRVLVLELSLSVDAEARPLLDLGGMEEFPWPDLEHLSVSHPVTRDPAYDYLPQSLRVLSLSCCPHLAEEPALYAFAPDHAAHGYPIQTCSEMLEILRCCHTPDLLELRLEYRADASESTLLRFLSSAFPKIQSLEIYRYREPDAGDIAVDKLAQLLSMLAGLRVLKLHLDFENTPLATSGAHSYTRFWSSWAYDRESMETFAHDLHTVASTLARDLSSSLEEIYLWMPEGSGRHLWSKFRVGRTADDTKAGGGSRIACEDGEVLADIHYV